MHHIEVQPCYVTRSTSVAAAAPAVLTEQTQTRVYSLTNTTRRHFSLFVSLFIICFIFCFSSSLINAQIPTPFLPDPSPAATPTTPTTPASPQKYPNPIHYRITAPITTPNTPSQVGNQQTINVPSTLPISTPTTSPSTTPTSLPIGNVVTTPTSSNTVSSGSAYMKPFTIVSPTPDKKFTRFAYVAMHYEGTPKDDEYVLGLRVLIKSIKESQSPYDVVVLVSNNVRISTKQTLLNDGAILWEVENLSNPFAVNDGKKAHSYKQRFVYALNKLYIWNMLQYERVMFLDSDNIIIRNIDELFMCGHFCVVYMNPAIFHTGLIVVKPNTKMFERLVSDLYSDSSFSHDGADQGYLAHQFDIEYAPLFNPNNHKNGIPSEEPAMRLNMGYNLNHFFYYIGFTWDWFRFTFKGYDYGWSQDVVPGGSIGYCSGAFLKPWYWFPNFYFIYHDAWQAKRELLGQNNWPLLFSRLFFLVPLYYVLSHAFKLAATSSALFLENLRNASYFLCKKAPVQIGYTLGFLAWLCSAVLAFQVIPFTTPSWMGFTIFSSYHCVLMFLFIHFLVALLTPYKVHSPDKEDYDAVVQYLTSPRVFLFLLCGECCLYLLWLNMLWNLFIIKIGAFTTVFVTWILIQIHATRMTVETMCSLPRNKV